MQCVLDNASEFRKLLREMEKRTLGRIVGPEAEEDTVAAATPSAATQTPAEEIDSEELAPDQFSAQADDLGPDELFAQRSPGNVLGKFRP